MGKTPSKIKIVYFHTQEGTFLIQNAQKCSKYQMKKYSTQIVSFSKFKKITRICTE
jgi:uncharacterized membrane protein (UPF0127 family)